MSQEQATQEAEEEDFGAFGVPEIRQVVALGRAQLDRPHTPDGDADAQRALVQGLEPFGGPLSDEMLEQLRPLMTFRSDFFDRQVIEAIARGITQVVNLGAGWDDRALRFRHANVTYYELDLPEAVAAKSAKLQEIGANTERYTLTAADFEADDIAEILVRVGHDSDKPTLFIGEHLFVFLEEESNLRLLAALARRAAHGSVLAATLEASKDGLDPYRVREETNILFQGPAPLRTILSRGQWLLHFEEAGWLVQNPQEITAVDHTDQIETQVVTAVI